MFPLEKFLRRPERLYPQPDGPKQISQRVTQRSIVIYDEYHRLLFFGHNPSCGPDGSVN